MSDYYITYKSRAQAFLAGNHLKSVNVAYEISHIPREIAAEPCALGLKISGEAFDKAYSILKHLNIPDSNYYKEIRVPGANANRYLKVEEET